MVKVALRGMATRRLRTALTALAIVLGVGMVAAAFTVGDTMRQAADSLSTSAYKGTDAVVSAPAPFKTDGVGASDTVSASVLREVQAVPGVGFVEGVRQRRELRVVGPLRDFRRDVDRVNRPAPVDDEGPLRFGIRARVDGAAASAFLSFGVVILLLMGRL